jgi:hypothetical protein
MPNWNGIADDYTDMLNITRQFLEGYGEITLPETYVGVGDGVLKKFASPPPGVSETWTLICTLGGGSGVATFSVLGSVSGLQVNVCTINQFYESDGGECEFLILDGAIDFAIADQFDVTVVENTMVTNGEEWTTRRWCPPPHDVEAGTFDFPERAISGNIQSYAFKLGVSTGIYHMQYADAVEFDTYSFRCSNVLADVPDAPLDWTFEYSDDGIVWVVADTQVGNAFTTPNERKEFNLGLQGRHFFWRLNITDNNGGVDLYFSAMECHKVGTLAGYDNNYDRALHMEGQGLSGTDNIHISMRANEHNLSPYYNWLLYGSTDFDINQPTNAQPGSSPAALVPRLCSNNAPMEYWLVGTGRYYTLTTKIGTDYLSCMQGLFLPYGQPAEYSYPLVIMGTMGGTNLHYTSTAIQLRQCFDPARYATYLRTPGGEWVHFENFTTSQVNDRVVWPYNGSATTWRTTHWDRLSTNLDGTYVLYALGFMANDDESSPSSGLSIDFYGEIQDVFQVSGLSNFPENLITVGGETYIVFQNVFRTLREDFYAVRLVP